MSRYDKAVCADTSNCSRTIPFTQLHGAVQLSFAARRFPCTTLGSRPPYPTVSLQAPVATTLVPLNRGQRLSLRASSRL